MRQFDPGTLGPKSSLWRGIKGEVNLPLGMGEGGSYLFSNTPRAVGLVNCLMHLLLNKCILNSCGCITKVESMFWFTQNPD